MPPERFLIRRKDHLWEVVDVPDVYYLEAEDETTLVRRRDADVLVDQRSLGQLEELLAERGFFRIHRGFLVNLARVLQVRRREKGQDWEVKMDPPVNKILPVSRGTLPGLLEALGAPH